MPKRDAKAEAEKPAVKDEGETSSVPPTMVAAPARNTLRAAQVVIRESGIPAHVAAAVLAGQGLTQRSLVDPKTFKQQVDSWLSAPAN